MLQIREAAPAGIPALLALMKEMAAYERVPDAMQADEPRLRRFLFGERAIAQAFLASDGGGEPAGYAIVLPKFSSYAAAADLYLEDVFVRESLRGRGYGKQFMTFLAQYARQRGYRHLIWSVLDWNQPAIGFYERLGARREEGRHHYSLEGEALRRLEGA